MDRYFKKIKILIEKNLVEVRKNEINSNYHTLTTYWNVGMKLVEAQGEKERARYGEKLIRDYSEKLTELYGKGYDYRNLFRMKQLYLCYPKVHALRGQLNWTILKLLLPIKNENKRNYYINSCIEHNFSVRQLNNYVRSNAYERLINKDDIKLKYVDDEQNNNSDILDMIKDPILITINKSIDKITEKALKEFMLERIEKTMLELGVGFCFAGSDIPIKIDNKILKPDLVFFNTELDCYVILELKLEELTIKDIGQTEFYIKYYDSHRKKPYYNLTIGITISKKINNNLLKYNEKENIRHTTYKLIEKWLYSIILSTIHFISYKTIYKL